MSHFPTPRIPDDRPPDLFDYRNQQAIREERDPIVGEQRGEAIYFTSDEERRLYRETVRKFWGLPPEVECGQDSGWMVPGRE